VYPGGDPWRLRRPGQRVGGQLNRHTVRQRGRVQDWPSVFTGAASAARDLADALEAQGLRPFVADREGPVVTSSGGRTTYSVVLVPPDEAERAAGVARDWEAQNVADARSLTGRLGRVVVSSLLVPAAWLLCHFAAPGLVPRPEVVWLVVVWFVSFIVIGQVESRRYDRERVGTPAA
jgi:hypothetical protein